MPFVLKLYLAHLVADFILQFEELYQLKIKSLAGHIFHALIHALVSLVVALPYLRQPAAWLIIGLLATIHYAQDRIKYDLQEKTGLFFPCFVLDQIIHFLFIYAVVLLPAVPGLNAGFGRSFWQGIYADDFWTLLFIGFFLSTFAGAYTLHNFRKNYVSGSRPDHLITALELNHGIIERGVVSGIFLFAANPLLWAVSPAIGFLRLFSGRLRNKLDFFLSFLFAALTGLIFRLWI